MRRNGVVSVMERGGEKIGDEVGDGDTVSNRNGTGRSVPPAGDEILRRRVALMALWEKTGIPGQ
jgi:hypothetical protein